MRKLVWNLLTTDEALNGLGITQESVFAETGVDTPQMRPFLVTRWGTDEVGVSSVSRRLLTVWVHDEPADYTRIDAVITRVRAVLEAAVARQDPDGGWLVQVEWQGNSEDLSDDAHGTVVRNAAFRVVGSGQ